MGFSISSGFLNIYFAKFENYSECNVSLLERIKSMTAVDFLFVILFDRGMKLN